MAQSACNHHTFLVRYHRGLLRIDFVPKSLSLSLKQASDLHDAKEGIAHFIVCSHKPQAAQMNEVLITSVIPLNSPQTGVM